MLDYLILGVSILFILSAVFNWETFQVIMCFDTIKSPQFRRGMYLFVGIGLVLITLFK